MDREAQHAAIHGTAKNILNFFSLGPAVKKFGPFTLKAGSSFLGYAGEHVWVVDLKGCGYSYIYKTPICSEFTSDVLLESKRNLYLQSRDHKFYKMIRGRKINKNSKNKNK